jgi:predicted PurR-regulated permease PerM
MMSYLIADFIIGVIIAGIALYIFNNIHRWRFYKRIRGKRKEK